ncbi:MAG: MgtC/SapB family protein, partial [Planctomycetia bacterium]|nr:MgtC/SapB family protein [Planctomycetia bacterium]
MELSLVAQKLAIAVGLGLLVGLQRERVRSPVAGIRTFALITVLGTISALLAAPFGGWIVGLGAVAVAAMLVVGNLALRRTRHIDPGMTTEVAALLMYGVGAYLVVGHAAIAVAVGGGVALLLHWKAPLHEFVARIGETDVTAIMRFVLVALVIYPVLPDQAYGPYQVLNPKQVWQMVVLIVGISLGGYVAYKLLGQKA